jgi:hypothetical protein
MFKRKSAKAKIFAASAALTLAGAIFTAVAPDANAAVSTACNKVGTPTVTAANWSNTASWTFSRTHTWCAYNEAANRRVIFQSDGNLVAYSSAHTGGAATWKTATSGRGSTLKFQTDGNVVIYDSNGKPLWSAGQFQANPPTQSMVYQFGIQHFVSGSTVDERLYSGYKVSGGHLNIPRFYVKI